MTTKKKFIYMQFLKLNNDLFVYTNKYIFPDFYDAIDILFYFSYNFLDPNKQIQVIDDILEINNVEIDDLHFGKVCDLIIDFVNLLNGL